MKQHLDHLLTDKNPVMLEYSITLCERFFMIYPLEMNFKDPVLWAMAILSVVESYIGQQLVNHIIPENIWNTKEFNKARELILEVEQHLVH